eukprot:Clim_evm10s237 gene=Clim_evmTU10s237
MSGSGKKALVVGGSGFLGTHIITQLLERGFSVAVFDVRRGEQDWRSVEYHLGDIRRPEQLMSALKGVDVVFHCATPDPNSKNGEIFRAVNVEGTANLIQCCHEVGVQNLVLTSSASVVYNGEPICKGDESLPYANPPMDFYTSTKAEQEDLVLKANDSDLHTIAIRPHGIFGEGDRHMFPVVAKTAKAGKMRFIIGDGRNLVDFTYVGNVAYAHVLAAECLMDPNRREKCCGKAYNITNCEPIPFWGFMNQLCEGLGYQRPQYKLPYWLIYCLAVLLAYVQFLLNAIGITFEPIFTPSRVALAGTHHYYDSSRAIADMGYQPKVTLEEGIRRSLKAFAHLSSTPGKVNIPSNATHMPKPVKAA